MTDRAGSADSTSTLACHPSRPRLAATAVTAITDRSHLRTAAGDGYSLTYGRNVTILVFAIVSHRELLSPRSLISLVIFVIIPSPMFFFLPSLIYQTRVYRNFEFRDRAVDTYRSSGPAEFLEIDSLSCEGVVFR